MMEHNNHDIQLSSEDNTILTTSFTNKEVYRAFFQMEHSKASISYGFSAEFPQKFCDVIKADLMAIFFANQIAPHFKVELQDFHILFYNATQKINVY